MDGGGGTEQWRLWTAQWWLRMAVVAMGGGYGRRSSGARWHGGGAGRRSRGKEVRQRLRGAVVLEDAGWSLKEVERRGWRSGAWLVRRREGGRRTGKKKKSNRRGYIKIRSLVNPMRQRRERWCKSRASRRTEHRLNRR
jgi:hypothetical protein